MNGRAGLRGEGGAAGSVIGKESMHLSAQHGASGEDAVHRSGAVTPRTRPLWRASRPHRSPER
ncbi:hypothetical protein SB658_23930, partial [Bacillus sp. SIMBA_008]|uniref:hypothetical protein n=1 Tax=Bacillus sp. SIMBA_008 TaxID=3085757 RepID=UPI003979D4FC